MKKENIEKQVIGIVKRISGAEKVLKKHTLIEDVGFDSLKMVTLVVTLEDELKIELDESDMNPYDLKKVSDVIKLAKKYCEVRHE